MIVENYTRTNCGSTMTIDCPGGPGCGGDLPAEIGPSGFPRFKYGPIRPADIGRVLPQFSTGRGSLFTSQSKLSVAGQIWFGTISDAMLIDCADGSYQAKAESQGATYVTIVTPAITVTKAWATNQFSGLVCNSGDISLTNVTVSGSVPGAAITFANQTALGNPFPISGRGRLAAGDCIAYIGSFTPGDPCAPFTDSVIACGTDQSSIPKTVCATNSAVTMFGSRLEGTGFVFSFAAANNRTYTVQFTDSLLSPNWQTITNLPGNCSVATIHDPTTHAQRFYRVSIQ
jgi:hypothetical protein